jgi:hypothetical protein
MNVIMGFESTGMWPTSLKYWVELEQSLAEIERRLGVRLERGRDERGAYVWTAGRLGEQPLAFDSYATDSTVRMYAEDAETAAAAVAVLGLSIR